MKTFTDCMGRTWTVTINVGTIKRVKTMLGINLLEAITDDLAEKLKNDVCLLVDVLYVICKNEADVKNITDENFGEAMAGDVLENATNAFLDELIDFFPAEKKMILRKAINKVNQAEKKALEMGNKYIENMEIEKQIETKLLNIFNGAMNSQE